MSVELLSANHAAALAATLAGRANRKGRGFVSGVYPITPSTEAMEFLCQQKFDKGRVIRVESEHSAMGVCIGGASAGARTFTATSSNGLAYMYENCIAAAYLRMPVVLAVVNRTLGPPWNIWADQGDALTLRDHGLVQFYCADNQELFDSVLMAFRLAEDKRVMMPVMINMEGFILSHTVAQTDVPDQGQVDDFLPPADIPHRMDQTAHTLGQMEVPHQTEVHRWQHHQAMLGVAKVYEEVQHEFENVFGRRLAEAVETYCAEDAETLIVSMGTIGLTAERVVDSLREKGKRIGAVRVRLYRPFPAETMAALFKGKKAVAVIDRDISIGTGGVLWSDVRSLAEPSTVLQGYMAGLGGGDVRPEHIERMLADLASRKAAGAPAIMEAV